MSAKKQYELQKRIKELILFRFKHSFKESMGSKKKELILCGAKQSAKKKAWVKKHQKKELILFSFNYRAEKNIGPKRV